MPFPTDPYTQHSPLGTTRGPGDTIYKGAILAAAMLVVLTAWF